MWLWKLLKTIAYLLDSFAEWNMTDKKIRQLSGTYQVEYRLFDDTTDASKVVDK
jgi:hypothetical protein